MKFKVALPLMAAVTLFFALAGCGSTASSPGRVVSTLTPGTADLNGCPTQHIPIDGTNGSTVVVTNSGAQDQAVTVTVGQTVVVELPAKWHWELDKQDSAGILGDLEPEGYFNSAKSVCVWRFPAQATGAAQLKYTGTPVCAPGVACPALAMVQQFTINVQ